MTILTSTPGKIEHAQSPLWEISRQLGKIGGPGTFAARTTAPAGDLHREVRGVGRVRSRYPPPSPAGSAGSPARPFMVSRPRRVLTQGCATHGKWPRAESRSISPDGTRPWLRSLIGYAGTSGYPTGINSKHTCTTCWFTDPANSSPRTRTP